VGLLSVATAIQMAKELKSVVLAAADWAKRKDMGQEAARYAGAYALADIVTRNLSG
jgi:hypothetical protein